MATHEERRRGGRHGRPNLLTQAFPATAIRPQCRTIEFGTVRDRSDRAADAGVAAISGERNPLADPLVGPSRVEVAQCVFGQHLMQLRF